MKITDVRIRLANKADSKMKAVASITFDGEFVVHDIKVIEGDKGLFIGMPYKTDGNGERKDVAHPIVTKTREMIQDAIIAKYNEAVANAQ